MLYPKQEKQLAKIKKYVERELDIPDIASRCRDDSHVVARTLYYYLATHHTFISMNRVAKYIGRTHATVINAMQPHKLEWSLDKIPEHIVKRFNLKAKTPNKLNAKYFYEIKRDTYLYKASKIAFAEAYYKYRKKIEKEMEQL